MSAAGRQFGSVPWALSRALLAALLWGPMGARGGDQTINGEWKAIREALAGISLEGNWNGSVPIAASPALQLLGAKCTLEHDIEAGREGDPRSRWRIPVLETKLVSDGRDAILWYTPSGSRMDFPRAKLGFSFYPTRGNEWSIRKISENDWQLRRNDGSFWNVSHGRLVSIDHPVLGHIAVEGDGGPIRNLCYWTGSRRHTLLSAEYDGQGHCTAVGAEDGIIATLQWNGDGELRRCLVRGMPSAAFSYAHGLISRIDSGESIGGRLTWTANQVDWYGDSRYPKPAHLSSDGTNEYNYAFTDRGLEISRVAGMNGRRSEVIVNPLLRTIIRINDGRTSGG